MYRQFAGDAWLRDSLVLKVIAASHARITDRCARSAKAREIALTKMVLSIKLSTHVTSRGRERNRICKDYALSAAGKTQALRKLLITT
jgi:hypothetical protein